MGLSSHNAVVVLQLIATVARETVSIRVVIGSALLIHGQANKTLDGVVIAGVAFGTAGGVAFDLAVGVLAVDDRAYDRR